MLVLIMVALFIISFVTAHGYTMYNHNVLNLFDIGIVVFVLLSCLMLLFMLRRKYIDEYRKQARQIILFVILETISNILFFTLDFSN